MVVLAVLQVAPNLELQEGRIQDATVELMPLLWNLEQIRAQEDLSLVVLIIGRIFHCEFLYGLTKFFPMKCKIASIMLYWKRG
ncbi:uncharacterized protein DS421_2g43660 [Arachis hypogaea]|nr:uncharacterized protein DS421_2g43660 [Arachis hypogaea]